MPKYTIVQVVSLDNKDYILRYKDFGLPADIDMREYIAWEVQKNDVAQITVIKYPRGE